MPSNNSKFSELSSRRVIALQRRMVAAWHAKERRIKDWDGARRALALPRDETASLVASIARINSYQWHEEDKARDASADDAVIARIKRSIDASNQRRVNEIERLDLLLEKRLAESGFRPAANLPLSSETPGSIVDRLSILILKTFHMRRQSRRRDAPAAARKRASGKVPVLEEQLRDLGGCLDALMRDAAAGKRRFKTYFQFKMYNDPETNPYLLKNARTSAATASTGKSLIGSTRRTLTAGPRGR